MIWYAFEILIALGLIAAGVLVYTFLIHSPAFARFLDRLTTTAPEDAEENLEAARFDAAAILAQERQEIKDKAARAARLKKSL
jgi:hypothetical protein